MAAGGAEAVPRTMEFAPPDRPLAPPPAAPGWPMPRAGTGPQRTVTRTSPGMGAPTPPPEPAAEAPIDLGLDAVAERAEEEERSGLHSPAALHAADLQKEVDRLRRELDEAKKAGGGTSSPFSREREFLNLREVINRKEKELIELKEEVDGKDRQVLTGKEKIREVEKKVREAEERSLSLEQNLVTASEQVATLGHDKEKGTEREKGLKARLEMSQGEVRKAHEEVESLKKRVQELGHEAEEQVGRERAEADRQKRELSTRVAQLEEGHRAALEQAAADHQAALGALERQLHDDRAQAVAAIEAGRAEEV